MDNEIKKVDYKKINEEDNEKQEIIEIKNINNNEKNEIKNIIKKKENSIIGEIYIKEEDIGKKIRIINSFEEYKRNEKIYYIDEKDYDKYENEKEIKDNCKIKINDNNIGFNYCYEFKEKGKYIIQYTFIKNITKTDFMFNGCASLIMINLSNFNTQNVTNMYSMFNGCSSLANINLTNTYTHYVIDMGFMFNRCSSLKNISLANFNTQKVTNMYCMFNGCSSLTNINLTNFNTQNVTNMSCMFNECSSLTNIDLSKNSKCNGYGLYVL